MVGVCGCYVVRPYGRDFRGAYLPQLALTAHATILSTASSTSLTQVFQNTEDEALEEVKYAFPLYDGVTVIDFKYHIGTRVVQSKVKPKALGNIEYRDPFAEEQPAAAKDRNYGRNDMFILCLGKVPARERIIMKITFIGQLEHDAQMSSIRYRLPTFTAPIYAHMIGDSHNSGTGRLAAPGITVLSIAVDVHMETRVIIRDLHSPSHSVHTDIGRTSMRSSMAPPMPFEASAFINLRAQSEDHTLLLDRDFILVVKADGLDNPRALLESHSTIPCQRALMVNLVSKFKLPFERPEIVFVVDRTKSMDDKMPIVKSALDIFIKCLPPGIYFNICSFGHHYSFLWNKSRVNDSTNLMAAMGNIATFRVDTDATDVYPAVVAAVHARIMPVHRSLEVVMLTDGQTSNQTKLPTFARETAAHKNVRFFSLAIGDTVSHSWIEEVAKLGNGFSQSVRGVEELNPSVLKLLDGAISPHITDWNIKLDYDNAVKGDFEILNDYIASDVDSDTESQIDSPVFEEEAPSSILPLYKRPEDSTTMDGKTHNSDSTPKYTFIQAPHKIPHIQFKTTTVFLLMTSEISKTMPRTVIVSGSYKGGVISMRIPISDAGKGKTIHQLACRAAVPELKEIRCQFLAMKYQVPGKNCYFVGWEPDIRVSSGSNKSKGKEVIVQDIVLPFMWPPKSNFDHIEDMLHPLDEVSYNSSPHAPRRAEPTHVSASALLDRPRSNTWKPSTAKRTETIETLINMQSYLGNWEFDHELLNLLNLDKATVLRDISKLLKHSEDKIMFNPVELKVFATFLAIAFMTKYYHRHREIWMVGHQKACGWLGKELVVIDSGEEISAIQSYFWQSIV